MHSIQMKSPNSKIVFIQIVMHIYHYQVLDLRVYGNFKTQIMTLKKDFIV